MGLIAAAIAALAAGAAFVPRSFPTVDVLALRQAYLTAAVGSTQLRLLDTHVAACQHTHRLLKRKASLVMAAALALGLAVLFTVLDTLLG